MIVRDILIAGNWKMNRTPQEAAELVRGIASGLPALKNVEVAVCPPFTSIASAVEAAKGTPIVVGAQNIFWEPKGAYTGEISGQMLKAAGCTYAIIGHSERRQYFGETDATVRKRILRTQEDGLIPIFCLGETLEERDRGAMRAVVEIQMRGGLEKVPIDNPRNFVIAYEPVWAIGTGVTASPEQAQEVHGFLRELLQDMYGEKVSTEVRILYGGSVTPENALNLLSKPDIDGALVGGASLKAETFLGIINHALEVKK